MTPQQQRKAKADRTYRLFRHAYLADNPSCEVAESPDCEVGALMIHHRRMLSSQGHRSLGLNMLAVPRPDPPGRYRRAGGGAGLDRPPRPHRLGAVCPTPQGGAVTHPNKRKGSAFELAVAKFLTAAGVECERTRAGWSDDRGDLDGPGLTGWAVECKDVGRIDLAGFTDQAASEALNKAVATSTAIDPVVVIKRRNRPVSDAYCVIPLTTLARLIKENP